jgi:hypothetical protein
MEAAVSISRDEKKNVFKLITAVPLTARIIKCGEEDVCMVLKERIP